MEEMLEDFEELMTRYYSLKQEVRRRDKHLYEQWKASGFCIDTDILSMYPNLSEVMDRLKEPEETEDD